MVRCNYCKNNINISGVRTQLSQENKEILNLLERQKYDLNDFCYCSKLGFIESKIMHRNCAYYEFK